MQSRGFLAAAGLSSRASATIKGAALNTIQIAETIIERNLLRRPPNAVCVPSA
jgi:hypothetical protein